MVTKRDYLIEKGLIKGGRGRWPLAAHEEIKKAINKGIKFTDGSENSGAGIGGETAPARTDRPEGRYEFKNPDGSTFKRLHTNACAICNYSFQWCYCPSGPSQFVYPHRFGLGEDVYAILTRVPDRPQVVVEIAPRRTRRTRTTKKAA